MAKQIDVVGAVIERDGRIFAARRGSGKALAGFWEFPGGKIEPGESPQQALRRELVEELGCLIDVGEHITTTAHEYDFGVVNLSTYWATIVSGQPTLTEHTETRWLGAAELDDVQWAPADIPAIALIRAALTK